MLATFLAWGVRHHFHGNGSALFYFGEAWAKGGALPRDPIVRTGPGYDGQFYYRVAREPVLPLARLWSHATTSPVDGIDTAWYRYRRIAYPLAARFATLGALDGLVWSFPLVSVASLWLGVFSTARLFQAYGWRGEWGLGYALLPGLVFAASRNLCDGLSLALVSAGLLAVMRRRTVAAIGLLTAAHLAHEATALVSLGCSAYAGLSRGRWREAAAYLVPVAAAALWAATVAAAFGVEPSSILSSSGGAVGLGWPFAGIGHRLLWLVDPAAAPAPYSALPRSHRFWRQEVMLVLPIVLALVLLLRAAWQRKSEVWPAGLLAALFVLSCSDMVWQDAASYARVGSIALLLALRSVAESPDRLGYAFLASLPFSAFAALTWCWDNWRGWLLVSG